MNLISLVLFLSIWTTPLMDETEFQMGALDTLLTEEFAFENCIWLELNQVLHIPDRRVFEKEIRSDASRDFCLQKYEDLDFEDMDLIGVEISTGWCYRPQGLVHQLLVDHTLRQYQLHISYMDPGTPCRALSRYDLWIKTPELDPEYTFSITMDPK